MKKILKFFKLQLFVKKTIKSRPRRFEFSTFIPHFPVNICLYSGMVPFLLFSPLAETMIQGILHAPTLQKLQIHLKKHKALSFQKTLCEKQLQLKAIPYACYSFPELKEVADSHCLELRIKNVTLSSLKKALPFHLSTPCRKHLKNFEKILLYRQKDTFSLKGPFIIKEKKTNLN